MNDPSRKVLFLCTGNYYRSRYAEEYFNHLAEKRGLAWRADSRGLKDPQQFTHNVGPMSSYSRSRLEQKGVTVWGKDRYPKGLEDQEIARFDLIIAMDEQEHAPMVESRPTLKKSGIRFWNVRDLQFESAEPSIDRCERLVEDLIEELKL